MGLDQAAGWTTNHEPLTEDNKVVQISDIEIQLRKFALHAHITKLGKFAPMRISCRLNRVSRGNNRGGGGLRAACAQIAGRL